MYQSPSQSPTPSLNPVEGRLRCQERNHLCPVFHRFHTNSGDSCVQLNLRVSYNYGSCETKLTVAVAIVCGDFFTNGYVPESSKCDVSSFPKKLAVVLAVMLS